MIKINKDLLIKTIEYILHMTKTNDKIIIIIISGYSIIFKCNNLFPDHTSKFRLVLENLKGIRGFSLFVCDFIDIENLYYQLINYQEKIVVLKKSKNKIIIEVD